MRGFIVFFVAAFLAAPAHAKERGTVVGYIAAFKGIDREMQQRGLDRYTHLMLAFVNPTPAAEVVGSGGGVQVSFDVKVYAVFISDLLFFVVKSVESKKLHAF